MVEVLGAQNKEGGKKCTVAPQQQEKKKEEGWGVWCGV